MQIQVYKETYHQPVSHIDVPKALQNQAFEVIFMPILPKISAENATRKRQPNPLLKGLVTIHDDMSPIDDNDWELD